MPIVGMTPFEAKRRACQGTALGFLFSAAFSETALAQAGSVAGSIPQAFWQKPWFEAAVAGGLLLLLSGFHRIRVRAMERRQFELMVLAEQRGHGEARYRELFENATDAVFTTDLDGNFTELNRKAETLIGYSRDTAGLNLKQLLPESEETTRVLRHWLDGVADTERVDIITSTGERVPVEVSTRLVEDAGKAVGMQAIARDVRERDALERQLRQSQKMEAVGQLAGGVAHDFNNLLTVIRGNAELLMVELPVNDPARRDVEQINQAADRAAALTRQLLAFSRKQIVQPRELDVNELLSGLQRMLQRLIGEDFTILTLPSHEPAHVIADPGQLEQVLLNLVVNARDAMPSGGTITIETAMIDVDEGPNAPVRSTTGRAVVLSVSDTGSGMDAATQARIFEPFFTTKEVGKGTGLGLSTVFGIVQQAGGQIACSSQPGKGTTFKTYLPYVTAQTVIDHSDENTASETAGHETILLVEDEDAVRALASRILRRGGYKVIEARHGQDALTAAHDHPYHIDLLLSDIVLPAMNGLVLSKRLGMSRPGLRVLLMSGYTDDEIVRRGLHEPGIAYLQKPFTPEVLATKVRAVLDTRSASDAEDIAAA
ncbi:MAG: ATP-binding protein [Gemmatimonadota bacterium]